ncbi:hypothetical protein HMPREF1868_00297 [Olsenella sp. DNF00959]|nr:hypothetical protein HMPREF1868_00297 [Olsenella sp. DNF00959]
MGHRHLLPAHHGDGLQARIAWRRSASGWLVRGDAAWDAALPGGPAVVLLIV